jgi:hypothetical protein
MISQLNREAKEYLTMLSIPRRVENNVLHSEKLPVAQIKIDPQFSYTGNTSFVLYNVAHVEQHHFIVADEHKRVQRLLWFQFEGYLDNNNHKYNYSGLETMVLGNLTLLHDADVSNIDDDYKERPTSDSAHVVEFFRERDYAFGGDAMFKRMVWLDHDLRNELMIIYSEDLAPTGFSVSDLTKRGPYQAEWDSISKALQERALASFSIQ